MISILDLPLYPTVPVEEWVAVRTPELNPEMKRLRPETTILLSFFLIHTENS
jgi:hypothetical protein